MNAPFAIPTLRYLSVCSGIESASVAWEPLGFVPVAFAEIAAFPSRVLAARWPHVPNLGDFTAIDVGTLGPVDILVGGTPCQAFSVAGRRLSLADARGNLSLSYAMLAHELARSNGLRWAVWENVPGVLSTDDNAFGCLLGALVGGDDPVEPVARPQRGKSNTFWRWRNAGTEVDDDGQEIAVEAGHVTRWPSVGMAAGPLGRAAWRIFDAQYFGLAQRRRRVFVVVGLGDGADPAAVLFERQGLRRHPSSRGEAGAGVAEGAAYGIDADCLDRSGEGVGASAAERSGLGVQAELAQSLRAKRPGAVAYGGNDTQGPIEVSTVLNAHGGPHGRQDFESETFVVAPPLTSNPYGDHESREGLLVAHSLRGEGFDANEDGTGRGTPIVPVCFDPRQTDVLIHGDKSGPLDTKFPGPAIAFQDRFRGDDGRGYSRPPPISADVTGALETVKPWHVATAQAVRRLTPTECARLQGFPDDHCAIPGAKDGPIYMALGNSKAVPVVRWIGQRIAQAEVAALQAAE